MWGLVLILVVLVLLLGLGYLRLLSALKDLQEQIQKKLQNGSWGTVDLSGLKKRIGRLDQAGQ